MEKKLPNCRIARLMYVGTEMHAVLGHTPFLGVPSWAALKPKVGPPIPGTNQTMKEKRKEKRKAICQIWNGRIKERKDRIGFHKLILVIALHFCFYFSS